jgi:hypothetical protein
MQLRRRSELLTSTQNTDLPRRILALGETCPHSSIACQTLSRLSASYSLASMCHGISKQPNGYGFSRPPSDPRKPQRLTTKAAFEPIRSRASITIEHASPSSRLYDKETSSAAAHRTSTMHSPRASKRRRRPICLRLSHNAPSLISQRQGSPLQSIPIRFRLPSPFRFQSPLQQEDYDS